MAKGRFGRLILRLVIPVVCLGVLLTLLGILYRGAREPAPLPAPEPATPARSAPSYEELKGQYMEMVNSGTTKLPSFNGTRYRGGEEGIRAELAVFQAWALLINEMPRYPLTESEKETAVSVARQVSTIQKHEFPAMRVEWAKSLRDSFKRYGVIASCSGPRSENLSVICPPNAGEPGINETYAKLVNELPMQLRFSRISFTFTEERTLTATVLPFKKGKPPADDELVVWQEKSHQVVDW